MIESLATNGYVTQVTVFSKHNLLGPFLQYISAYSNLGATTVLRAKKIDENPSLFSSCNESARQYNVRWSRILVYQSNFRVLYAC